MRHSDLRRKEERLLETTELRMLWWIKGVTVRGKERIDKIKRDLAVENITLKATQTRLPWHGHIL